MKSGMWYNSYSERDKIRSSEHWFRFNECGEADDFGIYSRRHLTLQTSTPPRNSNGLLLCCLGTPWKSESEVLSSQTSPAAGLSQLKSMI